jgi:hypothetical protein
MEHQQMRELTDQEVETAYQAAVAREQAGTGTPRIMPDPWLPPPEPEREAEAS